MNIRKQYLLCKKGVHRQAFSLCQDLESKIILPLSLVRPYHGKWIDM
jgi:hypothetical protein